MTRTQYHGTYDGSELGPRPYQSYSILRGKFDKNFAKVTEKKGVSIVTKSRVDDLIIETAKWKGHGRGRCFDFHIVIACDGVLSLLAEKAGLRKPGVARTTQSGSRKSLNWIVPLSKTVSTWKGMKVLPVCTWVKLPG
jgi:electron transfer flavoprotein-quinone oxidoreductase